MQKILCVFYFLILKNTYKKTKKGESKMYKDIKNSHYTPFFKVEKRDLLVKMNGELAHVGFGIIGDQDGLPKKEMKRFVKGVIR